LIPESPAASLAGFPGRPTAFAVAAAAAATAAAATAAVTALVTAATTAAALVTAAAGITASFGSRARFVNGEIATLKGFAVALLDGCGSVIGRLHFNESEASGPVRKPVHDQVATLDCTDLGKQLLQV
jgi:hypothetical protein